MARISIIGWIVKKLKGNIALVEDSSTASQNISANQFVNFQGDLCTADAAISQGDTLATSGAGKNLTEVTGGGFNALNDHIATVEGTISRTDCSVSIETFAGNVPAGSLQYFRMRNSEPTSSWNYSPGIVLSPTSTEKVVILFSREADGIAMKAKYGGSWTGWKTVNLS